MFNKFIYNINTIIQRGIWQPVKFQLVSRVWIGAKMKWFLSYLWMLAALIQRYDKNSFPFKNERQNWNCTGCQVPHFMIVLIPYINLFNFLDIWTSIYKKSGALKSFYSYKKYKWRYPGYFITLKHQQNERLITINDNADVTYRVIGTQRMKNWKGGSLLLWKG